MATDAIVLLERLNYVALVNTESRTEPYIWPALIRIDDGTLNKPAAKIPSARLPSRCTLKSRGETGWDMIP